MAFFSVYKANALTPRLQLLPIFGMYSSTHILVFLLHDLETSFLHRVGLGNKSESMISIIDYYGSYFRTLLLPAVLWLYIVYI